MFYATEVGKLFNIDGGLRRHLNHITAAGAVTPSRLRLRRKYSRIDRRRRQRDEQYFCRPCNAINISPHSAHRFICLFDKIAIARNNA
jgi:hypothetical protein